MKRWKKSRFVFEILILLLILFGQRTFAAPSLNKTKVYLTTKETVTLKVRDTKKKAIWSSGNKKVVTVKNGVLTPVSFGTAEVTATVGKTKLTCTVIVRDTRVSKRILRILEKYSQQIQQDYKSGKRWYYGSSHYSSFLASERYNRKTTCLYQLFFALREMGIMQSNDHFCITESKSLHFTAGTRERMQKHGEFIAVKGKTVQELIDKDRMKPGDICFYRMHANVYAGNGVFYDTGRSRRIQKNGYFTNRSKTSYVFISGGPVKFPTNEPVYYIYRLNY